MTERRVHVWRLVAVIFCGAALWGLWGGEGDHDAMPPPLEAGLAKARLDGGQMLGLANGVPPNDLSRLNLGELVDFKTARPDLLGRLPGLGVPTINSGRERGYLLEYQSRRAAGLITNHEKTDEKDETRPGPDNL